MRPTTVSVVGQPFSVEYSDAADSHPLSRAGAAGRTMPEQQRLVVKEGMAAHQERDTLLHEVLHVIGEITGAGLKERHVGVLAPVLLDVLRQNPALVAYLTESME